ncbi:fatty acyl-AMP ligase [Gandjariella thermophila]|uniref:Acyl-CoA synthetase n=1 Tax=Gandjariella thermophila TaxID=1931992 RepID=A0A4D4J9P8_9PSEU|nr:fatty acyl-AMP ligase [Gandjariella thermophila]GDY33391.1 acyl-CoA synthetase [Gandjariella thermophila]
MRAKHQEATAVALSTLVDLCRARAAAEPDRRSFVFLADGVAESDSLTLAELDRKARAIAVVLRAAAAPGARALLSYPPGLDFHAAFFGCLYAGVIPVPVAALDGTRGNLKWTRVDSIAANSRSTLLLSTADGLARVHPLLKQTEVLAGLTVIATDEVDAGAAEEWTPPEITADTVAYLQYSSGSTGEPKGVVLTHANVLHNLSLIHDNLRRPADEDMPRPTAVTWLPLNYNLGLISGVLEPLFGRHDVRVMPAPVFVQRPFTWLRAISDLGRADSVAPNFGYEFCARRVTDAQRRTLDLGGWEMALVGGEPVRAGTLDRFCAAFAPVGFRRESLFPAYGLAESTLMVSGGPIGRGPVVLQVDRAGLAAGRVRPADPEGGGRPLVSCGQIHPALTVLAVHPSTGKPCGAEEIGEIVVSGPSVGAGYWNAPAATADAFAARLPDHPDRQFLRTGDLGVIRDGQLFVTGRAKELLIIAGANHYPHDIEATVQASHPAAGELRCCALSVDDGERERLVVLAEAAVPAQEAVLREVQRSIRRAVNAEHGLQVHEVILVRPGSLPFTTSGKIQRRQCQERYAAGEIPGRL